MFRRTFFKSVATIPSALSLNLKGTDELSLGKKIIYPDGSYMIEFNEVAKCVSSIKRKFFDVNGDLHRDDGPAVELLDGTKYWYKNGDIHRDDGPAIEHNNGTKHWYKNGDLHRDDGPAVEQTDGHKYWYKNGKFHRDDGPAIEYNDGTKYWYKNGKLHRDDGPAIEYNDGTKIWYKNGKLVQEMDDEIDNVNFESQAISLVVGSFWESYLLETFA